MKKTVTDFLQAWRGGSDTALDKLMARLYSDLRQTAVAALRRERSATVLPSDLVNDYFLRLLDAREIDWQNRSHFLAIASKLMRRILVDHARQRIAKKRGAGATHVNLEGLDIAISPKLELLELEQALDRLAEKAARPARLVELRFFGGLTIDEAADVLEVAPATTKLDWSMARAWLRRELS